MNSRIPPDPRLLETLSAYLDGRLPGEEVSGLQERLQGDSDLRRELAELRAVRDSLRSLPVRKPPRPLTLTPDQADARERRPGFAPHHWAALGSALAALAFVFAVSLDVFSSGRMSAAILKPAAFDSGAQPAQLQSEDSIAMEPGAAEPTVLSAAPSVPDEKNGGGISPSATNAPPVEEPIPVGCNDAASRCEAPSGVFPSPTSVFSSPPDFQTLAPFLETALGLTAVLLAALAVFLRRRR
jgi:anti-sigma factor RsiW